MIRREFIAGFGSAALWPLAARAQHPAVIGVLGIATAEGYALNIAAFSCPTGTPAWVR
jgi:hypothetical protein